MGWKTRSGCGRITDEQGFSRNPHRSCRPNFTQALSCRSPHRSSLIAHHLLPRPAPRRARVLPSALGRPRNPRLPPLRRHRRARRPPRPAPALPGPRRPPAAVGPLHELRLPGLRQPAHHAPVPVRAALPRPAPGPRHEPRVPPQPAARRLHHLPVLLGPPRTPGLGPGLRRRRHAGLPLSRPARRRVAPPHEPHRPGSLAVLVPRPAAALPARAEPALLLGHACPEPAAKRPAATVLRVSRGPALRRAPSAAARPFPAAARPRLAPRRLAPRPAPLGPRAPAAPRVPRPEHPRRPELRVLPLPAAHARLVDPAPGPAGRGRAPRRVLGDRALLRAVAVPAVPVRPAAQPAPPRQRALRPWRPRSPRARVRHAPFASAVLRPAGLCAVPHPGPHPVPEPAVLDRARRARHRRPA